MWSAGAGNNGNLDVPPSSTAVDIARIRRATQALLARQEEERTTQLLYAASRGSSGQVHQVFRKIPPLPPPIRHESGNEGKWKASSAYQPDVMSISSGTAQSWIPTAPVLFPAFFTVCPAVLQQISGAGFLWCSDDGAMVCTVTVSLVMCMRWRLCRRSQAGRNCFNFDDLPASVHSCSLNSLQACRRRSSPFQDPNAWANMQQETCSFRCPGMSNWSGCVFAFLQCGKVWHGAAVDEGTLFSALKSGSTRALSPGVVLPWLCSSAASQSVCLCWLLQLLQQGFHPDSADYDRRTALHLACANGHTETVRVLLAAGADTSYQDNFGAQPLHEACRRGHDPLIDLLLRRGARHEGTPSVVIQHALD